MNGAKKASVMPRWSMGVRVDLGTHKHTHTNILKGGNIHPFTRNISNASQHLMLGVPKEYVFRAFLVLEKVIPGEV